MSETTYDFVIIGSGFGGSVAALRLTEKGYRVCVVECGKRFDAEDFAKTNWQLRKYLWAPKLFCYGIQRLYWLNDVLVLGGSGVGGGSLVYGNTLLKPARPFYEDPSWSHLEEDWQQVLEPFYQIAKTMLGVTTNRDICPADGLLLGYGKEINRAEFFKPTEVGIYFGEPGVTVPDPYFGGRGPDRTGCSKSGHCMVGCRDGGKNSLDRNYLYLAEKMGLKIISEYKAVDIRIDDRDEYIISAEKVTDFIKKRKIHLRTSGVVLAAGVIGTLELLMNAKEKKQLPNLSEKLGQLVRTNSETLGGITVKKKKDINPYGIAITSGLHVDDHTHIQVLRYPAGSDLLLMLGVPMADGGTKIPRFIKFFWECIKNPLRTLQTIWPFGKARRSVILLIMQTLDNYLTLKRKRRWWALFKKVMASENNGKKIPNYIPAGNKTARYFAEKVNGIPQNGINETLLNIPMTAHILGGCVMGEDSRSGVIDKYHRVFGYKNMYVVDGSAIPANLGVNPSLTITAMAERAMRFIPEKKDSKSESSLV